MLQPGVAASLGKGNCSQVHKQRALDAAQALRDVSPAWSLRILCQQETQTGQRGCVAALSAPLGPALSALRMLQAPTCTGQGTKPIPSSRQPQPSQCHHQGGETRAALVGHRGNGGSARTGAWSTLQMIISTKPRQAPKKKPPNQPNLNGKDLQSLSSSLWS